MKKILGLILTALIISAAAVTGCREAEVKVKKIPLDNLELNRTSLTLDKGQEFILLVTKEPANATDKLVWTSENTEYVSVNQNGKVKGLKVTEPDTEIVITVSNENLKIYETCYITVIPEGTRVPVNGLTLTPATLSLKMGQTITGQLVASVSPENATDQSVSWTTSDASVARVSANGEVTAQKAGTATITAKSNDNSSYTKTCAVTVAPAEQIIVGDGITIIDSSGWLETLYVKWEKMGAASYNVYYKGNGIANWTKIDTPLIREYGDHYRADILGLKAGLYDVEVRAADASGKEFGYNASVANILVEAHIRSGFAFLNGKVPGAYNMDGTVKTDARIIYITEQNKETVTIGIMENDKNKITDCSGLQNIIGMYEKGYESRPLIIRFIGRINEKKGLPFTDSQGTVNIKGNSGSSRPNNVNGMNITFEGVGDDAVAYGWGFRTSRANNVEIRNLAFMLTNTSQKDSVELQNSTHIWLHNCDFFYGEKGGDSDQKKGDGALDMKECDLITISFNHFWDSGKSSLLGNGGETPGRFTYHHNWFDHSDSRHPLVRDHKAHIYNNLFDGVGKYGMIARLGASIFADRNYFQNTKKPILISQQGTDIVGGSGVASDAGGMIKAFNNYFDTASQADYRPYNSSTRPIEFDAYEVTNPGDSVPANITAKKGGAAYDNTFITNAYSYNADTPQQAKTNVTKYAGRYWGGDFTHTFAANANTHTDDPMTDLLAKLRSYTSKLVSIQGGSNPGPGNPDPGNPDPGNPDPGNPSNPDPGQPPAEGSIICTFYLTKAGTGSSVMPRNNSFTLTSASGNTSMLNKTVSGILCEIALKLESNTKIDFTTTEPMTLKLYTDAPNGNVGVNGTNRTLDANGVLTFDLAAGSHQITRGSSGKNLWLIVLEPK